MIVRLAVAAVLAAAFRLGLPSPAFAQPAFAAPPPCTGTDLLEAAQHADPAAYKRFLDRMSAVPNVEGLLWKIERAGTEPSYLFGTMHVTDDGAVAVARTMAPYVGRTRTVATELGLAMSKPGKTAIAIKAGLRALSSKVDTASLIPSEDDRGRVGDVLKGLGIDPATALRLPPWMLLAAFAMPACEMARQKLDQPTVDQVVMDLGTAAGAKIVALESVDEQLDALQSFDPKLAVRELIVLSRKRGLIDDTFATMLALYRDRRIGALLPLTETLVDLSAEDVEADKAFMKTIVENRNYVMVERARPLIDAGPAFIAVGALHLVGEHGLVQLLRQAGYTVTRVW